MSPDFTNASAQADCNWSYFLADIVPMQQSIIFVSIPEHACEGVQLCAFNLA